jgi:translation elongation factor EF-Ts
MATSPMGEGPVLIKELREKTGAGIMDCKRALVESGNSVEKAIKLLREKGLAAAQRREGRSAMEVGLACCWKLDAKQILSHARMFSRH